MNSLKARLVLAGVMILAAFLGLTGLALDQAFQASAREGVRAKLQAQVYGLLGALELDAGGRVQMPDQYPDQRLQQPGSGSYAQVIAAGPGQSAAPVWSSRSLLGRELGYHHVPLDSGQIHFERTALGRDGLFELRFGVVWEYAPARSRELVLRVLESDAAYRGQLWQFRRSLVLWLGVAGAILLLMQVLVLQWGLRPLRRIPADLQRIHAGEAEALGGHYPHELRPLTENLNEFIRAERTRGQRYRDAMADLAHSLKTPLAVIRGAVGQSREAELNQVIGEQTARMQEIVDYQLQRAALAGRGGLRKRVNLYTTLQRIRDSLSKVYADKQLEFELRVDPAQELAIEAGDLMELLGNLLDNACKWAVARVRVSAGIDAAELRLSVEDDGPGIDAADRDRILQRGVRADEATPGHGIGLAMVRDIVQAYGGRLEIDASAELGGARLVLVLPRTA
ncbi:putative histidine kinase [Thiohalobacter thiocyanaticus]|uniref:histidine kinase n=1 Tax=Thiohalobacter thiocyanaticus TaxID=585455 RepID=A0A1Z4VMZ4_9GAMM|nr:ATP-binding protein [Thiohalobacter thiocyanaticus]BAZ92802.1 putative histidine kinase [Thiohalobacter thiocyanaticus]